MSEGVSGTFGIALRLLLYLTTTDSIFFTGAGSGSKLGGGVHGGIHQSITANLDKTHL